MHQKQAPRAVRFLSVSTVGVTRLTRKEPLVGRQTLVGTAVALFYYYYCDASLLIPRILLYCGVDKKKLRAFFGGKSLGR